MCLSPCNISALLVSSLTSNTSCACSCVGGNRLYISLMEVWECKDANSGEETADSAA